MTRLSALKLDDRRLNFNVVAMSYDDMKLRIRGLSCRWVGGAEWFGGRVGPMAEDSRRSEGAIDCRIDLMSDHWPLLVAEPLDGERLVNSQLRPRARRSPQLVRTIRQRGASSGCRVVCGTWGGGGMPLVPVTVGESVDERWSRILNESNIDGIERTDLLSDEEVRKYTDLHGPDTAQLIRIVASTLNANLPFRPAQGLSEDDPWHSPYLAVLGDVSPSPASTEHME